MENKKFTTEFLIKSATNRLEYLCYKQNIIEAEEIEIDYLSMLIEFYDDIMHPELDLTKEDAEIFFNAIINIKEPNAALKHAASAYKNKLNLNQ